ncbi:MAG: TlpA family protein disulfide reductase [Prevotella sp.]|nr:TlpA family protein disulfide reductase [Prevotella sp.]
MRRLLLMVSMMACCLSWCQAQVKYEPEYIIEGTAGQQIVYDPTGTVLENDTDIKCVLYIMRNYWWEATDVALTQTEGKWIGRFDVPGDAVLVCAKMMAGGKTDWGWPATYASFVLDKNKQNKEGARMGWALLRTPDSGLNLPGMMDAPGAQPLSGETQLMWFNNEFAQFPQAQPHEFGYLVKTLNRVKPGEKKEQLRQNLTSFLDDKKLQLTDQQWSDIYDIALRTLGDSAIAKRVREREKKDYPDGIISRDEELLRIQNLFGSVKSRDADDPTAAQAQKDFVQFLKRFPSDKFWNVHSFTSDLFYSKIFRAVIYDRIMRADDYSNLATYIHDIPFEEMIATHWHVAEIPFINQQITAEKALPYSEMLIKEILNRPRNTHAMQLVSPNEWNAYVVEKFNMALYAHARILNATGRTKESMKYMEMVYPYYSKKAEYADLYVKLLNQLGRQEEVIPYIKQCVPEDATTQEMLDLLKSDYLTNNPNGDFDQFLASLKNAEQIEKDRAKAIAELIDLPVTLFTLDRMGGGKVNLADKKGKIIFLDFWATWCAPCKASMPGGQMTVNRWKDNKDVEFYFIDTQETKADYRKTAEAFIKSKDFTFTVLYDNGEVGKQDEQYKSVASVLHTSGIPLKVILDRRGHIRWMGSGYHGSPTQMADEISYILEYLLNE